MTQIRPREDILEKLQGRRPAQIVTTLREDKSGKWVVEGGSSSIKPAIKNPIRSGFFSTFWPGAAMASAIFMGIPSGIVIWAGIATAAISTVRSVIKRGHIRPSTFSFIATTNAISSALGSAIAHSSFFVAAAGLLGRPLPTKETKNEWAKTTVGAIAGAAAGAALAYSAALPEASATPKTPSLESTNYITKNFSTTAQGAQRMAATDNQDYKLTAANTPTLQPQ